MNREWGPGVLWLALIVCVPALSSAAGAQNSNPSSADAKQQVQDLEQQWITAENKHDANTLRRILDDQFISTFGANAPHDKDYFIRHITAGEVDPTQAQTLTDETVVVDGDTAVSVGTDTISGTNNGAVHTSAFRYTLTYIHRNGQWLALAEHIVKAPEEK